MFKKSLLLGSCFATEMGEKMGDEGYQILNNPFGVIFNPMSIYNSIKRIIDEREFTINDVIERDPLYGKHSGATIPKSYASFYHHSSFASSTPEGFLSKANQSLKESSIFLKGADTIIVTFGTAWVFRHIATDIVVSNCHKIPNYEFKRERLEVEEIVNLYLPLISEGELSSKQWIFTVSPIRHLKDGLHGNQISKATLLLSIEKMCARCRNAHYFPSYEIVIDELRDYSYYAEDTVHPSVETINIVWERFHSYINSFLDTSSQK